MNDDKIKVVDVVIPHFNENDNLLPLVEHIRKILNNYFSKINFILVDDGSVDGTDATIEKIDVSGNKITIKYIRLSKNHGKDLAIKCGIDHAQSKICAILDGDFQHPPEKILEAVKKIQQGYNIVHIEKEEYKDAPLFRKMGSIIFFRFIKFISEDQISLTDFKLLDEKAIKTIKEFKEKNYFNRGIVNFIGLRSSSITYKPKKRKFGTSKYSLLKLIRLAINSTIAVSIRPLSISIYCGLIISTGSLVYGIFIFLEKIFLGQPVPGFATLACALFFIGGIQLLFMGIIGQYIGKMFIESKQRPQYIIEYIKEL